MEHQISGQAVIELMLQFCKENSLLQTYASLKTETEIKTNFLKDPQKFADSLREGKWQAVLPELEGLDLERGTLMDVYEHLILELCEKKEWDLARYVHKDVLTQRRINEEYPSRYALLKEILKKQHLEAEVFEGESKEEKRSKLCDLVLKEIKVAKSGRLPYLLAQGLSLKRSNGVTSSKGSGDSGAGENTFYNLFEDRYIVFRDQKDEVPNQISKSLKFPQDGRVEVLKFTPDGRYLLNGTKDGVVEVWNPRTKELAGDISFQNDDIFMMHKSSITSICPSPDSQYFCSSSIDGEVKVWQISQGKCLRSIPSAHKHGASSLLFFEGGSKLISAHTSIKIWGLQSGLKVGEMVGHKAEINNMQFFGEHLLLTSSSDGSVRAWNLSAQTQKWQFSPDNGTPGISPQVLNCHVLKDGLKLAVVTRSNAISVTDLSGKTLKVLKIEDDDAHIEASCLSSQGMYLCCSANNGSLYFFSLETYRLESFAELETDVAPCDLQYHPHKNLMVISNENGSLSFLEPQQKIEIFELSMSIDV